MVNRILFLTKSLFVFVFHTFFLKMAKTAAKKPTTKKPATKKPAAKKPAAKKPAGVKKPATKKPATKKTIDKKVKPALKSTVAAKKPGKVTKKVAKKSTGGVPVNLSAKHTRLWVRWDPKNAPAVSTLSSKASDASKGYVIMKDIVRPSAKYAYEAYGLGKRIGRLVRGGRRTKQGPQVQTKQTAAYAGKHWALKITKIGGKTIPKWAVKASEAVWPPSKDKLVHDM